MADEALKEIVHFNRTNRDKKMPSPVEEQAENKGGEAEHERGFWLTSTESWVFKRCRA